MTRSDHAVRFAPLCLLVLLAVLDTLRDAHAADWFVQGGIAASEDTDDFRVTTTAIGIGKYLSDENFIDRLAYRRARHAFRAPNFALDGDSDTLAGDLALGGRVRLHGEISAYRSAPADATLGAAALITDLPGEVHGELSWEKGLVDSVASLNGNIRFEATTLAVDKTFAERWNVAVAGTRQRFTDDNTRDQVRTRASVRIDDDLGIGLYVRTRQYWNSRPFNGNYFAPDTLREILGGVSLRRRIPGWPVVASGWVDAGQQTIDGSSTGIRSWQVKLEALPQRPWHLEFALGEQTTAGTGGGPNYEYRYLQTSVVVPF